MLCDTNPHSRNANSTPSQTLIVTNSRYAASILLPWARGRGRDVPTAWFRLCERFDMEPRLTRAEQTPRPTLWSRARPIWS